MCYGCVTAAAVIKIWKISALLLWRYERHVNIVADIFSLDQFYEQKIPPLHKTFDPWKIITDRRDFRQTVKNVYRSSKNIHELRRVFIYTTIVFCA